MLLKSKKYKAGEIIIHEKTVGNSAYIIETGKVEVSRKFGDQRIVFTTLDRGAIFGEMCLIDQLPRSATVTAVEDTTLTIMGQVQFQNVLKQLSSPVLSIIKVMTERLRLTGSLVNPLKLTNYYFSICSLIYFLAKAEGKETEDGLRLNYKEVLSDCSTILALETSQVEKVLNRMILTKLLHLDRGDHGEADKRSLIINDLEQFKKFVDFLRIEIRNEDEQKADSQRLMSEETYEVLKRLTDETKEFQPRGGMIIVNYERCLQLVEEMFDYNKEEANSKIFQPLFEENLFKLTIDPESGTSQIACQAPERLKKKLEEQEVQKVFKKMVNLLKALAG